MPPLAGSAEPYLYSRLRVVSSSAEVRSCCTFDGYFSNPLIASGARVALEAPRFGFCGLSAGVEEGEGVSVGDGVSVAEGVSVGSAVGDDFFFCFADGEALGEAEADFFFADAVGDGDSDCFFAVDDFFFLCGVGVGVGVEKIFLILSPTVSSAADAEPIASDATIRMRSAADWERGTIDVYANIFVIPSECEASLICDRLHESDNS